MIRWRARAYALAMIVAAMFVVASAARAEAPLEVLMLGEVDPELRARIEGQTGDLAVRIAWSSETETAGESDARGSALEQALIAGRRAHAAIVVVVAKPGGEIELSVVDVRASRSFVRRVRTDARAPMGESALYESVALIIRGALSDLLTGASIGIGFSPADPAPNRENGGRSSSISSFPAPAKRAKRGRSSSVSSSSSLSANGIVLLGVTLAFDGESEPLHAGATLGAGAALGRTRLIGQGTIGFPASLDDGRSTVRLSRHGAWLTASFDLVEGARAGELAIAIAASGGAFFFHRITEGTASGLAGTGSHLSVHGFIGIGAELRLALSRTVALGAGAGLDLLPSAPELVYDIGDHREIAHRLAALEPRGQLLLVVALDDF